VKPDVTPAQTGSCIELCVPSVSHCHRRLTIEGLAVLPKASNKSTASNLRVNRVTSPLQQYLRTVGNYVPDFTTSFFVGYLSIAHYVASNGEMNDKSTRIWKEAIVA
jgi:hypothetical protein